LLEESKHSQESPPSCTSFFLENNAAELQTLVERKLRRKNNL
jgi:hypothetical protein